jgi:uncharacterized protein with HEPN domain
MWRDESYLLDILIGARDARDLSAGLSWDEFKTSRLHQLAISKTLEMIGEAPVSYLLKQERRILRFPGTK